LSNIIEFLLINKKKNSGVQALAPALTTNQRLATLILRFNAIGDDVPLSLPHTDTTQQPLKNNFSMPQATSSIGTSLCQQQRRRRRGRRTALRELDLGGNRATWRGARRLAAAFGVVYARDADDADADDDVVCRRSSLSLSLTHNLQIHVP
jgi:Ran GTPase-activating protein (RanGAP) involved in mRNA processing and transport